MPREIPEGVTDRDLRAAASASNQFAFDLLRRAAPAGTNAVLSPLNARHALGLALAGAAGQTLLDMGVALHMTGPEDREHAALAGLVAHALRAEPEDAPEVSFATRIWVERGLPLAEGYAQRVEQAYGSAFESIDFGADPAAARLHINGWVSGQTRGRIPEVLPDGSIHTDTRLVLGAAVYLNARWSVPFARESTREADFTLADASRVRTPTMHRTARFAHAVAPGHVAVELPYRGSDLSMVIVMPTSGGLDAFEADLDAAAWDAIVERLSVAEIALAMPKFELNTAADLARPLRDMGMAVAFSNRADFSRMVETEPLLIDGVHHGAFLRVDEAGTEAAAATVITMAPTSAPVFTEPVRITIDRPFLLAIRDRQTGAILFLGRVMDPR